MLPNIIIYSIAGLIAFIILAMVFLNTIGGGCNGSGHAGSGSAFYDRYDPLSSHARLYTLPAGVKSSY